MLFIEIFYVRAADIKETSDRREALRKCEKYANKLARFVEEMEKNTANDVNVLTYGKRLLHVVSCSVYFIIISKNLKTFSPYLLLR